MAIQLRVARSERQVDDALWLRHQVYVIDDGKFGGVPLPGERIVDRYDAFPGAHNIVVYDGGEPVATMRVAIENAVGMPALEHFDFTTFRAKAEAEWAANGNPGKPRFASAGMLAIRPQWRHRRDVLRAMFKVAAGVSEHAGITHITIVVNHETAAMYRRLGFAPLSDKVWDPLVQNHIVPMVASGRDFHEWAFGDLPPSALDTFKDSFERLFLKSGEVLFREGDQGDHAYVINAGEMRISKHSGDGDELTLATLNRGELFGELALMDDEPRSATAIAESACELITLDRSSFLEQLESDPLRARALFSVLCRRIRTLDDFATRLAFGTVEEKLESGLFKIRCRGQPDPDAPAILVARGNAESLARIAGVPQARAETYLSELQAKGDLELGTQSIRFLN